MDDSCAPQQLWLPPPLPLDLHNKLPDSRDYHFHHSLSEKTCPYRLVLTYFQWVPFEAHRLCTSDEPQPPRPLPMKHLIVPMGHYLDCAYCPLFYSILKVVKLLFF
jgi:hypothetical protein